MFEKFTDAARAVVRGAVEHGERAGEITPEHLLLALLDREGTVAADVLAHFAVDRERAAEQVRERVRRGGLSRADTDALAGLGIDVDAVIAAVEREHGVGALAPKAGRRRFHTPFSAAARRVLERSLREAVDLRHKHIGDEHILLALLADGTAAGLGLDPADPDHGGPGRAGLDYAGVRSRLTASRRGTGRS